MDLRELGAHGERLAADYLIEKHFQVIERNWRCHFGEVDLVCLDQNDEIVFVEVKTRESLESGYPEDSVTDAKRRHLAAVGESFLEERHWGNRPFRFDVVAIYLVPWAKPEILHLQGI